LHESGGEVLRISAIIPSFHEADRIASTVTACRAFADEVIVADGASLDGTAERAAQAGARVVTAAKGRGCQLNAGARVATGDVFVFVHADALLPAQARIAILAALEDPSVVGGNFKLRFVPETRAARLFTWANDARRRHLGVYYGDSCIFVRRRTFERIGGFPSHPIFEDYALARALDRLGRTHYETSIEVRASSRRFAAKPVRTLAVWGALQTLYSLGVSPRVLARLYADAR
jgi:rSAM/selenodomain-associated transferase 2